MDLRPRKRNVEIPDYSLTGDLLAFHRCGIQYRLQNRGRLPPSTPVQPWVGGFMHGVMEESYYHWRDNPRMRSFPWDYHDALEIQKTVNRDRLRPKGLIAPSVQYSEDESDPQIANKRAFESVNGWGPHLFPLVEDPEVPLRGLRDMPKGATERATYYEVSGVVDVLVAPGRLEGNKLLAHIQAAIGSIPPDVEIIVDYKAADRPAQNSVDLQQYFWQLQTYSWLRARVPESRKVAAGVLLFLNELWPSRKACYEMSKRVRNGQHLRGATDEDEDLLRNYEEGGSTPPLSLDLRLNNSIVVIPIVDADVKAGLEKFDNTVHLIESAVAEEMQGRGLIEVWAEAWRRHMDLVGDPERAPDRDTCIACDHRSYCPIAPQRHGPRINHIARPQGP